jgi:hypothetical protein
LPDCEGTYADALTAPETYLQQSLDATPPRPALGFVAKLGADFRWALLEHYWRPTVEANAEPFSRGHLSGKALSAAATCLFAHGGIPLDPG